MTTQNTYGQFNISVAKLLGLETAIYLEELKRCYIESEQHNKIQAGFFQLNRTQIRDLTTLTKSKQESAETILLKLGLIAIHKEGTKLYCCLNIPGIVALTLPENESIIKSQLVTIRKTLKDKKDEAVTEKIMLCVDAIVGVEDKEKNNAFKSWATACIDRYGAVSRMQIKTAYDTVTDFSRGNKNVFLKIVDLGCITGYNNIDFAIQTFKERYPDMLNNQHTKALIKGSDEVF